MNSAAHSDVVEKVALNECFGQVVKCPVCGQPAEVNHARGAMSRHVAVSSQFWVLLRCKGPCGSTLQRVKTLVEREKHPEPEIRMLPVGQTVGKCIACPTEMSDGKTCGQRARAAWTLEDGHVIDCPRCQRRRVDPATIVKIFS